MKLVKATEKVSKIDIFLVGLNEIEQYILFAYLFCMLGIFPLFYKEQYYKIGDAKFQFFWKASLIFIAISVDIFLVKILLQKIDMQKNTKFDRRKKSEKEYALYINDEFIKHIKISEKENAVKLNISDIKLWDTSSPNLYTFKLQN